MHPSSKMFPGDRSSCEPLGHRNTSILRSQHNALGFVAAGMGGWVEGQSLAWLQPFHSHAATQSSGLRQRRKIASRRGKTWKYLFAWGSIPLTDHGVAWEREALSRKEDVGCWCHPEVKEVPLSGLAAAAGPPWVMLPFTFSTSSALILQHVLHRRSDYKVTAASDCKIYE